MNPYGMKPYKEKKPSWKSIILNMEFVTLCKMILGFVIFFSAEIIYFGFIEIKNKIRNQ